MKDSCSFLPSPKYTGPQDSHEEVKLLKLGYEVLPGECLTYSELLATYIQNSPCKFYNTTTVFTDLGKYGMENKNLIANWHETLS